MNFHNDKEDELWDFVFKARVTQGMDSRSAKWEADDAVRARRCDGHPAIPSQYLQRIEAS